MFRSNKLSSKERQLVNQFVAITSTSEKQATDALKRNGWALESSLEAYFNHVGSYTPAKVDTAKLEKFFADYEETAEAKAATGRSADTFIGLDGVIKLCEEMNIDPETDVVMLVLSWELKAQTICEFSKDEFIRGQRVGINISSL
jgi:DCN1-like protein 1/2